MAPTKSRLPLSRERILDAALELVDANGVDALTMRRLGQELGYEAMSLYNHVANKDDVLGGILELVFAESEPPAEVGAWDDAVRASAVSVHATLRRHPWSCALLITRFLPARLRYMDSLLGRLRGAGFSADTTYHAYHVLDGHIFGFSLWETSHTYSAEQSADMAALFEEMVPNAQYPHLHEHGRQHMTEGPHREVSAFEFGLDLILDGLRRLHGTER